MMHAGFQRLTTKTITDEYIDWLAFVNAGMLTKGNIYCMDHAIKNLPSGRPILEIGSFCGLSTNIITYLLLKHNKANQVICADKWVFEGAENGGNICGSSISHDDYREFVLSSFKRNINFFSAHNKPYAIELFSDELFEQWGKNIKAKDVLNRDINLGGKLAFCYIDGNHTYDYAKRDFENANKFLEVNGYILFDDSADSDPFGLTSLMNEIKMNRNYKLVMKNPNYLFKKIA